MSSTATTSHGNPTISMEETTNVESTARPRRVRTGCLTCRARHLKCDENFPTCLNCRKSARKCNRGVRLNFIDTTCQKPPHEPIPEDWQLGFMDESRSIASGYVGGEERYSATTVDAAAAAVAAAAAAVEEVEVTHPPPPLESALGFDFAGSMPAAPAMSHQALPPVQGMLPTPETATDPNGSASGLFDQYQNGIGHDQNNQHHQHHHQQNQQIPHEMHTGNSVFSNQSFPTHQSPYGGSVGSSSNTATALPEEQAESSDYITDPDETLYMQVFVEEVGLWMDSMDPMKHFSRIMPFHALRHPMLLNAFLACGLRHLVLIDPTRYDDKRATDYYDVSSKHLLRALQNPGRDSIICATTTVILNVYEIMSEKALPRMNHIAGARALIKECGWDARSTGIGAACFWLNVGLETLSNLHFNWQSSWRPDDWQVDLDLTAETASGREEIWTHRMMYITAKISDYRAVMPQQQQQKSSTPNQGGHHQGDTGSAHSSARSHHHQSPHATAAQTHANRLAEWHHLKRLADTWVSNKPRTMHPLSYVKASANRSGSSFPEVWLIKRTTIIARLFYHTAMIVLAQTHPEFLSSSSTAQTMSTMEQTHAREVCGIVAHVKDRGVASVATRCLAHAAECLTSPREQQEVLEIYKRIHRETGWRVGSLTAELRQKWGWDLRNPSVAAASPSLPTHADPLAHLPDSQKRMLHSRASISGGSGGSAYSPSPYPTSMNLSGANTGGIGSRSSSLSAPTTSHPNAMLSPPAAQQNATSDNQSPEQTARILAAAQRRRQMAPPGTVNPMFRQSDFNAPNHVYHGHYVAPSHHHSQHYNQTGDGGLGLGAMPWSSSAENGRSNGQQQEQHGHNSHHQHQSHMDQQGQNQGDPNSNGGLSLNSGLGLGLGVYRGQGGGVGFVS